MGGLTEIEGACVSTVCQPVCVWCIEEEREKSVINRGGKPNGDTGDPDSGRRERQWGGEGGGFVNYLQELIMFEGERKSCPPSPSAPFVMIHLGLSEDIIFPRPLR